MPPTRFPRLADLLGCPVERLTEQALLAVVARAHAQPVREDDDLDFKQALYSTGDDVAADLAAMANARGGVIIIGIQERDGAAIGATPVPLSDESERAMRQTLADTVFPRLDYEVTRVPTTGTPNAGFYVLSVPPSPYAPHAVRKGSAFRYYRRDGPRNRPLSEPEIADAYRSRFREARSQLDALDSIEREGIAGLGQSDSVWITLAVVPHTTGSMSIAPRTVDAYRIWAMNEHCASHPGDGAFSGGIPVEAGVGLRRITLSSGRVQRRPESSYAELHQDGAAFAARKVSSLELVSPGIVGPKHGEVRDDTLVAAAFGLLRLVVDHGGKRVGVRGEAVASMRLAFAEGTPQFGHNTVQLGYNDSIRNLWLPFAEHQRLTFVPESRHTISLDACLGDPRQLSITVKLLLTDLFQALGVAEVRQIDATGGLLFSADVISYWQFAQTISANAG